MNADTSGYSQVPELSATLLAIGRKFYPRRYHRYRDLRTYEEACQWARELDWRENPYDRFLLRREILHLVESAEVYRRNLYTIAAGHEIEHEVDRLLDEFPEEFETLGVISYVWFSLPGRLHRRARARLDAGG